MPRPPLFLAIAVGLIAALLAIHHHTVTADSSRTLADSTADQLLNRPAAFTFVDRGDVSTLDLNRMSWMQDIRMANNLFEGLYRLDPTTLACIPGMAQSIDTTSDKMHFTFHLRSNAKWSNGDPVTTADFIFAWRRMLEQPGDYTYLFDYIQGAHAYVETFARDMKAADFRTVGIAAPDLQTLQVTLAHPLTFFPDLCAFAPFYPLNEKSMADSRQVDLATGRVNYDERFTLPGKLISNGPYKLTAWRLKVGMRLDANPYYWDAASVRCPSVRSVVAGEALVGLRKYDNGEVDWLAEPNADISSALIAQHHPDLHVCASNGTYFYTFNCQPTLPDRQKNPLADVRVRQAMSMVVNKQPIVDKITRCGEPPANDYIPPGIFPGYVSPPGLPFDVKGARRLLTEAGYPGGRGFPAMNLLFNTDGGDHRIIAEYITKQWKDYLNLTIDMEGVEISEFRVRLHGKKYAIARASWYGDYNDLSTFTDKYLSGSDNNDSGWVNHEYDQICAKAAVEPDVAARTELLQQAERILLNEAPILPLYGYTNRYAFHDYVKGLNLNSRNQVSFAAITTGRS